MELKIGGKYTLIEENNFENLMAICEYGVRLHELEEVVALPKLKIHIGGGYGFHIFTPITKRQGNVNIFVAYEDRPHYGRVFFELNIYEKTLIYIREEKLCFNH
ncbi:MAG: hypothetical protein OEX08_02955 [Candidatus Nomurabacteria bacterium]|nr:hypothetical protein [Candidatus Nomurabacteria bacterium]